MGGCYRRGDAAGDGYVTWAVAIPDDEVIVAAFGGNIKRTRKPMIRNFWYAVTLFAAMATTPAQAVPITFDFSGTISSHSFFDPWAWELTEDPTVVGQAFTARMTIETDQFGPPILTED